MNKLNKVKILGIGNQDEINYLIIKKEAHFFGWLNNFLFSNFNNVSDDVMYYEFVSKNGKFITRKKQIAKCVDKHESYTADGFRFDIFYGKNKIFMTIYCSLKNRVKLMRDLDNFCDFVGYNGNWKIHNALRK